MIKILWNTPEQKCHQTSTRNVDLFWENDNFAVVSMFLSDKRCHRKWMALGLLCSSHSCGLFLCAQFGPGCPQWVSGLSTENLIPSFSPHDCDSQCSLSAQWVYQRAGESQVPRRVPEVAGASAAGWGPARLHGMDHPCWSPGCWQGRQRSASKQQLQIEWPEHLSRFWTEYASKHDLYTGALFIIKERHKVPHKTILSIKHICYLKHYCTPNHLYPLKWIALICFSLTTPQKCLECVFDEKGSIQ